MALRQIVTKEDDVLAKKSREVVKFDDRLSALIDDLIDTLRDSGGVGLAAPQVGILRRVVVIEIDPEDGVLELVNPEIIEAHGEQCGLEGCLSLPGEWGIVKRPHKVTVKAYNRKGEEYTVTGENLLARCLCHEIDHLNGVLYDTVANRMLSRTEIDRYNAGELDFADESYVKIED